MRLIIRTHYLVLNSVSKKLQDTGDRLCKKGKLTDLTIRQYDSLQQRLSNISKVIADISVSSDVPEPVYQWLNEQLDDLSNDVELFDNTQSL